MTRLLAITRNTFVQTIRQPIFGIILLVMLGAHGVLPSLTGWTLDDDDKLLRDLALSTLLLQGLFLAAYGAAGAISVEIEDKTVLTVAAKPVGRATFTAGKYLGVFFALVVAHYIASLAMLMALRHGVLSANYMTSDLTVIVAGPGMMVLVLLGAAAMNYLFEWKFLHTTVLFTLVGLTISTVFLLFVDKEMKLRTYQVSQDIPNLPESINPDKDFAGIIQYVDITEPAGPKNGRMIRSEWRGPISDEERKTLISLSDDTNYQRHIEFLVKETRKLVAPQVIKVAVLMIGVLSILAAFAVAVSTRLSTTWTLTLTILFLLVGLVSDHYFGPASRLDDWRGVLQAGAYHVLPNFQFFWLIDAISEDNVIPFDYMGHCLGYAATYSVALLAIGAALFETREVG